MSYTTKQRNAAILKIGDGNIDVADTKLYEALESFQWIHLNKRGNGQQKAELTYSGKDLFKKLLKTI